MEEKEIRKYAGLMTELGLTGLEVKENGSSIRLEKKTAGIRTSAGFGEKENAVEETCGELFYINSPMIGMFYSSPAENQPPFVKAGDTVRKGDVLCIIEAMKLMNEITAEQDGTVVEICAEDGQVIDFGCPLFKLRKGGV